MHLLQKNKKPNVLHNFAKCLGMSRPNSNEPLMPIDRMPFGLIEFQIQFFSMKNAKQIPIPDDYYKWLETLDAEFEDRLGRLIRGPMWSGMPSEDIGDPLKARVNVAAVSKRTMNRRSASSEFTHSTSVQTAAIDVLKESNPDGRFWIKLDGTDIKESLMHSVRDEWNGDVNLNNGQLETLRKEYETRVEWIKSVSSVNETNFAEGLQTMIQEIENDVSFLQNAFKTASTELRKRMDVKSTSSETLKTLNWEVVECNTLLQQSIQFLSKVKESAQPRATVKLMSVDFLTFLKNLYKKKRTAATHVLVIALSDERRNSKPYTLPVQYIPYKSLKDQYVRDITGPIKTAMCQAGLEVVGLVTDGEFNSLRTQGDKEPLHVWQLVHDAKEAVRKMSKATIEAMLTYAGEDENGLPVAELPNKAVPPSALLEIVELLNDGLTFEDAITNLRGRLVPDGYTPYPFRRDTPESTLDKYRSLMATYYYRHRIEELNQAGRNFKHHLYVPEIDEITGKEHHERGDHNHIMKRIAASTRECRYQDLNPEAFDKALLDPLAALTHAALTGQRQQSVEDAEKLLSYHVAASMQRNGYDTEAEYVTTIASWHEASDGRGMSQLQRCKANHQMLGYIVDELMPWQRDTYDFTYLDINRPMDNIRGFTRETFVEITTNIESQERRPILTSTVGYSEHPRASTTDDVECFFSLTRRQLGDTFSLKDFKNAWPKIVREFTKKMDPALPFYYWTQNNRFKVGETSFDEPNDNARLHTVRHSQREDSSIFTSGRAFLPARNKPSIRQRLFRVDVGLPPVPHMLQVGRG